jgi:DNA-binding transcriptional LysR family regulator
MSRAKLRRYFRHGLFPQLLVFEAAARLGGVTRAADELHLAQPTVSLQLKKLAASLEVELFVQKGRKFELTPAGKVLQEECEKLIGHFDNLDERLAPFRQPQPEVLHLAAEPEAREDAANLLAVFCMKYPGVQATLHVEPRDGLLSRLATGRDDVYLFGLEVDGLPAGRRWSIAYPRGKDLSAPAELFVREALQLDAYNPPTPGGDGAWKSRETTTRL